MRKNYYSIALVMVGIATLATNAFGQKSVPQNNAIYRSVDRVELAFAQTQSPKKKSSDSSNTDTNSNTDPRLVAIGTLLGSHVYTTYAFIGSIADSFSAKGYKGSKVRALMDEQISMMESCVKNLTPVRSGNIVETDKQYIDDAIEIYRLLQQAARNLNASTSNRSDEKVEAFQKTRMDAWAKIEKFLGL